MLTAMLAAENILGANHDLWEVNEEQEYHEEIREEPGKQAVLKKALESMMLRIDQFRSLNYPISIHNP